MSLGRSAVGPFLRRPSIADTVIGLTLGAAFVAVPLLAGDRLARDRGITIDITRPDVALTVVSALALTQMRRRPLAALAAAAAASLVSIVGGWQANLAQLAVAITLFAFAAQRPRRQALIAATVTSVLLGAAAVLVAGMAHGQWGRQDVVLWSWLATAASIAISSRRATMAGLEDRARRAEETREETARRRVAEDRVRIARELHDVIAHHVAVISVQSGVAEHLVDRDPAAAKAALRHVRTSAKSVLVELQSVLGVLRQEEATLPTAPTPGLSALPELVASSRALGEEVEVDAPDSMPALAPAGGVAAFRMVQEALTNVHKHASGAPTTITVRIVGPVAEVDVANGRAPQLDASTPQVAAPTPAWGGSGLGLLGMRERVLAAGGSLETGPTADGGFRVAARLPVARDEA